jgi:hypothetical protein
MSGHFFVFMDKLVRCNVSGQFYSVHVEILKILNGNLTVGGVTKRCSAQLMMLQPDAARRQ